MIMISFASVSDIYYKVSTTSGMCYCCPSHARLHGSGFTHDENETFLWPTMVYEAIRNDGIQNHVPGMQWYTEPRITSDGIENHVYNDIQNHV